MKTLLKIKVMCEECGKEFWLPINDIEGCYSLFHAKKHKDIDKLGCT
jgi:hypothetical protein